MNAVFHDFLRKFVIIFFDDILVYSRSLDEHIHHLRLVFCLLRQHQLFLKKSKCRFAAAQVEYLGHVISQEGVATDSSKLEAISSWPTPTNLKQLRGFLGLAGCYRRFVRNFGKIAKPLTDLLKKDNFLWSEDATSTFQTLKHVLTTAPVLALPDLSKPFTV